MKVLRKNGEIAEVNFEEQEGKKYLNARFAPKEIKQQVIRADQLITYIKKKDSECKDEMSSDMMLGLGGTVLSAPLRLCDYGLRGAFLMLLPNS